MNCLDCGGSECTCKLQAAFDKLKSACQIFTQAFCEDGYIPTIGSIETDRAVRLMKEAGVKPVYHE